MPEIAVTGVKENIARFENVIMKQVYNEAGANSTTTAQVIDEETGNVICEAGSGGGGESDFAEFEITFDLTPPEGVDLTKYSLISAMIAYPDSDLVGGSNFYTSNIDSNSATVKILAYKGNAYFSAYVAEDGEAYYLSDTATQVLSDTITYDQATSLYKVTGNATIKATVTEDK